MDRATANTASTQAFLATKLNQTQSLLAQVQSSSLRKKMAVNSKIESLRCMAQGLVKYLCSEFQQKIDIDAIINMLGQKFKVQVADFSVLLGLAIKDELLNNKVFGDVNAEILQIVKTKYPPQEEDSDDDYNIEFDPGEETWSASSKLTKPQSQISNFYSKETKITGFTLDNTNPNSFDDVETQSELNLTRQIDDQNYNDDFIECENKEVMEYLNKLSQPTTELTYLCQKMKWLQPEFEDAKSKINDALFSCVAQVQVSSKNHNVYIIGGECPGAISKKQAKRVASLFILRKIYNRFHEVWVKFKKQRMENPSMQQPLNVNNQDIFKKAHFNLVHGSIFKDEEKIHEPKNQMTGKINKYLEELKSHKAELNILQGRYNKKITQVEFERDKQTGLNMWPVKAMIYADNQLLEADALESSKKLSQEKCCQKLLFKIYNKDVHRWEEFKAYKEAKGLN